jgi:hypothetical protein
MANRTRRELIRGGLVAGAATVGGGLSAAAAGASTAARPPESNRELIGKLVVVEQLIVFAYEHVLASASLSAAGSTMVRSFLGQEREHVKLLAEAFARLGGTPPAPPTDLGLVSHTLASLNVGGSLEHIGGETDAVRYLIGVETLAEGSYYSTIGRLTDAGLLDLTCQTMACEAQHWTALSGSLHAGDVYRAVPYPVVLG